MEIGNYEGTDLLPIAGWIGQYDGGAISKETLQRLLATANIAFVAQGITRLESMLLCELKDSYVQQSQRYVVVDQEGYSLPQLAQEDLLLGHRLVQQALDLYERMSQVKGTYKGRPKKEHYVHGIPVEDARYVLPIAMHTNISVAMSGDKLVPLFRLFDHPQYGVFFRQMKEKLSCCLPKQIVLCLEQLQFEYEDQWAVQGYYQQFFDQVSPQEPVQYMGGFADLDLKAGLGALTSTMAKAPSEVLAGWGEQAQEKAAAVTNRVLNYGHTSIAEQARTTFGMMFSLVTYHQQVRHRLPSNYREPLDCLVEEDSREVLVPPSIADSIFKEEYLALVEQIKQYRKQLKRRYDKGESLYFLLNCDQLKLISSSNARIDGQMLSERICWNAQWEIRHISMLKLECLRKLSSVLYQNALPSCVYGVCKEGQYTCGRAKQMREYYGKSETISD